ncbi:MAG: hypothetical protein AB2689_25715 [Candidatus Thiodiazotropha taylori]|nr:hypothetical protein [Candidatus Thiodiazotropha taylori]MCW4315762.1 hypothetical protein [Candidatus Thiodiazotropha taylori]
MEIVTSMQTLMLYAKELGNARKSGDEELIRKAQNRHDHYRDICLKADRITLPFNVGDLHK